MTIFPNKRLLLALCGCLLLSVTALAQDDAVVGRDTVSALQSVAQIDFDALPEAAGVIDSGNFAISPNGQWLALRNRAQAVTLWTGDGVFVETFTLTGADGLPATVVDMAFRADSAQIAALATDGAGYLVGLHTIGGETALYPLALDVVPIRVFLLYDADDRLQVWLEAMRDDAQGFAVVAWFDPDEPETYHIMDSLPEHDSDAVARIGRVASPYAVTSSADGAVDLWHLRDGLLASVEVGSLAMFGGINTQATHLAWRDTDLEALHLTDFATGEDAVIAALDGAYLAYIIVAPDADVVLGVNVADAPVVVAWGADGTQYDLGAYRACARTPDMARLSADGTTLAIGCDSGVDIWRVVTPERVTD